MFVSRENRDYASADPGHGFAFPAEAFTTK